MRLLSRSLRVFVAVIIAIASMPIAANAAAALDGASAIYAIDVSGTATSSVEATSLAGATSASTSARETITLRVHARALSADVLRVTTLVEASTRRTRLTHDVRSDALLRDTGAVTREGTMITTAGPVLLRESLTHANGWITGVTATASGSSTYEFRLRAIELPGSIAVREGSAVLLAPSLVAPGAGANLIRAEVASVQPSPAYAANGKAGMAAPLRQTSVSAYSRLTTEDNCAVHFVVWWSDFTMSGTFEPNQASYSARIQSQATFPNWFAILARAEFTNVTVTEATATGETLFLGYFPLGPFQLWEGHAYHQFTLNASTHRTWLRGLVKVFAVYPAPGYYTWRDQEFYGGASFPNDGTRQDATWCIVG